MSDKINHRRKNKPRVKDRQADHELNNGYKPAGKHGHLDKSMHSWGAQAPLSGRHIGAGIGNDFTDGHRGMARAVKGAKKFVRTRTRFHENAATRALADIQEEITP